MDEGGGVDHLGDLRQAPVAGAEFAVFVQGAGQQQHDAGPDPLAPGGK
jgi:hypothetical protein